MYSRNKIVKSLQLSAFRFQGGKKIGILLRYI